MLSFVFILALVATASSSPQLSLRMTQNIPQSNNRIVGGVDIDISQVPYQVSLQIDTFHTCGGSILTSRFVMTASHCIVGNEANWSRMNVRVSSTYNNEGGQFIKVAKFHSHPNYDAINYWHSDMAILELAWPIQLNRNALPVELPALHAKYPIGSIGLATGWGRLSEGGSTPTHLQGVRIPFNDPSVCEEVYSGFQRNVHICAASTIGGESTCQGDSGGPLTYNGVQYGIVSWAAGCAKPDYPTVFTHVSALRNFITTTVGI